MTKWNASQECKVGKRLKISVIQYNNRERQISQKAKTSDKIQYSFMIKKKISQQTRNEWKHSQIDKGQLCKTYK